MRAGCAGMQNLWRVRTLRSSSRRVGSGWYRPVGDADLELVNKDREEDMALRAVCTRRAEPRPCVLGDMNAGSWYRALPEIRDVCDMPEPGVRRASRFWTARRSWSSRGASASSCCCCLLGGIPADRSDGGIGDLPDALDGGIAATTASRASQAKPDVAVFDTFGQGCGALTGGEKRGSKPPAVRFMARRSALEKSR